MSVKVNWPRKFEKMSQVHNYGSWLALKRVDSRPNVRASRSCRPGLRMSGATKIQEIRGSTGTLSRKIKGREIIHAPFTQRSANLQSTE